MFINGIMLYYKFDKCERPEVIARNYGWKRSTNEERIETWIGGLNETFFAGRELLRERVFRSDFRFIYFNTIDLSGSISTTPSMYIASRWGEGKREREGEQRRENFNFPVTNLTSINLQNRASRVENELDDFPTVRRWIRCFVETSKVMVS